MAKRQSGKPEMSDKNPQLGKEESEMSCRKKDFEKHIAYMETLMWKLNAETDKKQLQEEAENIIRKMSLLERQKAELNEKIRKYEVELNTPPLKNAEEGYQKAFNELEANKAVMKDFQKCYFALERAVTTYQDGKIAELNIIMKELWQISYKDKDIDYIEMFTANSEVDGYTLMKVKDGRREVMRDRGSAFQKELACLVFRFAVTEVLSPDWGLFALDEPTQNLDEDGINSLAIALQEILNRGAQLSKPLQLLIKTQDNGFLDRLAHSNHVVHYELSKSQDNGTTKITLRPIL